MVLHPPTWSIPPQRKVVTCPTPYPFTWILFSPFSLVLVFAMHVLIFRVAMPRKSHL